MTQATTVAKGKRIGELDYLKGIMILLMIAFHLVYIGELYPYAKQVVYTFHMPTFLLLSGYLMNVEKPAKQFMRMLFWYAVPYLVMESAYTVMASILPIREHIDQLTPLVFLDKLFLHPLGPYWYLQALVLCGFTYFIIYRYCPLKPISRIILLGIIFAGFELPKILTITLSYYILAGIIIRQAGLTVLQVIRPSWLAFIAFALLIIHPQNLLPDVSGGILITYLANSSLLAVYPYTNGRLNDLLQFLGRNTLPLFVFSPIFTILCKQLVPMLAFDPTGMLFLALSLTISVTGSLAIAWLMDTCKVSYILFGRSKVIL